MTLHVVRLGLPHWQIAYRRDSVARHWWIDLWRWRFCVIQREAQS